MKKFWIQVIALIVVIFGALFFYVNPSIWQKALSPNSPSPSDMSNLKKLEIIDPTNPDNPPKTVINIELAKTADQRSKGLGFRQSLSSDSGMLFLYDTPTKLTFWMKGMNFPLDFIWILDDTIVDLLPNIPNPPANFPDSELPIYSSQAKINKVLEVNSGFIAAHNIKVGDKIKINDNSAH